MKHVYFHLLSSNLPCPRLINEHIGCHRTSDARRVHVRDVPVGTGGEGATSPGFLDARVTYRASIPYSVRGRLERWRQNRSEILAFFIAPHVPSCRLLVDKVGWNIYRKTTLWGVGNSYSVKYDTLYRMLPFFFNTLVVQVRYFVLDPWCMAKESCVFVFGEHASRVLRSAKKINSGEERTTTHTFVIHEIRV